MIKPLPGIIQIELEEAKAGALDTSSRSSAVEYGKVIAVGDDIKDLKKGDNVFVKSWAIDKITHQNKSYWFISISTNGILAIVK